MHIPLQNVDSTVRLKKYMHIIKCEVFYMAQSCEISRTFSIQSLMGWHSCLSLEQKLPITVEAKYLQ